ncbi:MAG: hypothetical protein OQJ97_06475 [Rhodospirillales bacterium]|nr:hypothetical protein [Rhodospirillales bacterium]
MVNADLFSVVKEAISDAHSGGMEYIGQMERAVASVLRVRPDLTRGEAIKAVECLWSVKLAA